MDYAAAATANADADAADVGAAGAGAVAHVDRQLHAPVLRYVGDALASECRNAECVRGVAADGGDGGDGGWELSARFDSGESLSLAS